MGAVPVTSCGMLAPTMQFVNTAVEPGPLATPPPPLPIAVLPQIVAFVTTSVESWA